MSERFFTAEEVAERLRVSKVTVHRWIRAGRLPAVNLGGTSGYRLRGTDVEAFLWTEYGTVGGYFRRAAHALYEASNAISQYGERFDNAEATKRGVELRREADRAIQDAEHFRDIQGFYRPGASPSTLRELQPFTASPHVFDAGNPDYQLIAIMVRDAIAGDWRAVSVQSVRNAVARAEASNPADTEQGRLVRIAGPLLLAHAKGGPEN